MVELVSNASSPGLWVKGSWVCETGTLHCLEHRVKFSGIHNFGFEWNSILYIAYTLSKAQQNSRKVGNHNRVLKPSLEPPLFHQSHRSLSPRQLQSCKMYTIHRSFCKHCYKGKRKLWATVNKQCVPKVNLCSAIYQTLELHTKHVQVASDSTRYRPVISQKLPVL